MSLKYRTSAGTSASNFTDLVVKVGDTLPIGSEIDYDGQTAPAGWQEVDDPNVYSTTETRIGTWIDGKPIYRKVFSETSGTASQTKTIATIANLGEIVNLYGFIRTTNQSVPINFVYNTEQNSCYRENNNIILRTTASSYVNKSCYVVVEYTKKSD